MNIAIPFVSFDFAAVYIRADRFQTKFLVAFNADVHQLFFKTVAVVLQLLRRGIRRDKHRLGNFDNAAAEGQGNHHFIPGFVHQFCGGNAVRNANKGFSGFLVRRVFLMAVN